MKHGRRFGRGNHVRLQEGFHIKFEGRAWESKLKALEHIRVQHTQRANSLVTIQCLLEIVGRVQSTSR